MEGLFNWRVLFSWLLLRKRRTQDKRKEKSSRASHTMVEKGETPSYVTQPVESLVNYRSEEGYSTTGTVEDLVLLPRSDVRRRNSSSALSGGSRVRGPHTCSGLPPRQGTGQCSSWAAGDGQDAQDKLRHPVQEVQETDITASRTRSLASLESCLEEIGQLVKKDSLGDVLRDNARLVQRLCSQETRIQQLRRELDREGRRCELRSATTQTEVDDDTAELISWLKTELVILKESYLMEKAQSRRLYHKYRQAIVTGLLQAGKYPSGNDVRNQADDLSRGETVADFRTREKHWKLQLNALAVQLEHCKRANVKLSEKLLRKNKRPLKNELKECRWAEENSSDENSKGTDRVKRRNREDQAMRDEVRRNESTDEEQNKRRDQSKEKRRAKIYDKENIKDLGTRTKKEELIGEQNDGAELRDGNRVRKHEGNENISKKNDAKKKHKREVRFGEKVGREEGIRKTGDKTEQVSHHIRREDRPRSKAGNMEENDDELNKPEEDERYDKNNNYRRRKHRREKQDENERGHYRKKKHLYDRENNDTEDKTRSHGRRRHRRRLKEEAEELSKLLKVRGSFISLPVPTWTADGELRVQMRQVFEAVGGKRLDDLEVTATYDDSGSDEFRRNFKRRWDEPAAEWSRSVAEGATGLPMVDRPLKKAESLPAVLQL